MAAALAAFAKCTQRHRRTRSHPGVRQLTDSKTNKNMNTKPPSFTRRNFLAMSAAVPAALLAQSVTNPARAADATADAASASAPKKVPIGLELYSVRGALQKDTLGTVRAVAKQGYEVVEFFAPYQQWSLPFAKQVRALLDDLGMKCHSTHTVDKAFKPGPEMAKATLS